MQPYWKHIQSPHHIPLGSTAGDFIMKKRSLPGEEPRVEIYQTEVHISNLLKDSEGWRAVEDKDFKMVMNQLTKRSKLYKIKGFDKLSLTFTDWEKMTDESAKYLRQNIIHNFIGLKSLAINFCGAPKISAAGIEQIARLAAYFKDLESFQIKFVLFPRVSDQALNDLIKRLQRSLRYLRNLHIDVSARYEMVNDNFVPTEPDLFRRLTHTSHGSSHGVSPNSLSTKGILRANSTIANYFGNLQDLSLNFAFLYQMNDKVCQELGQRILAKMKCLKRLYLNFNGCDGLTDQAMSLFSYKKSQRNLLPLEDLTLELASLSITDLGLRFLQEGITVQFKDLKRLVVNLMADEKITDNGVKEFNSKITKNLKLLQSFTLACYEAYKVTSESMRMLINDLSNNTKHLKELGLIFSRVDDDVLPAISSSLILTSGKLQKLTLTLKRSASSKFFNMKEFQNALCTSLKNLQELNLDFASHFIDNEVIMELGKSLQALVRLKKLALDFSGCVDIGVFKQGKDFYLGALVPKSVALEAFEVFFRSCENIEDGLLDEFGESLCQFQGELVVLHMSFVGCRKITWLSYEKLCKGVRNSMKKLTHLTLNFGLCWDISQDSKAKMESLLKEIPIVKLYERFEG